MRPNLGLPVGAMLIVAAILIWYLDQRNAECVAGEGHMVYGPSGDSAVLLDARMTAG